MGSSSSSETADTIETDKTENFGLLNIQRIGNHHLHPSRHGGYHLSENVLRKKKKEKDGRNAKAPTGDQLT